MKRILLLLLGASLLLGCSSGGGGSDGPDYKITADKTTIAMTTGWNPLTVEPQVIMVEFNGDGLIVGYPPGVPEPFWLSISTESVAAKTVRVVLSVPFSSISPGNFQTTLRLITGKADGSKYVTKDIPISLTISDSLALAFANDDNVLAGQVGGNQFSAPLVLNVETYGLSWQASSNVDWLQIEPQSGTGAGTVTVSAKSNAATAGWHDGLITVSAVGNPQSGTAAVKLALDSPRWWLSSKGIAFSEVGSAHALTRSVEISTSAAYPASTFSVEEAASWLNATVNGHVLNLQADGTDLPDGFYRTTVTVRSNADGDNTTQQVPVGFYLNRTVDLADRAFPIFSDTLDSGAGYGRRISDPIRPVVYLYSQSLHRMEAYHLYTGEKLLSLDSNYYLWSVSDDANSLLFREYVADWNGGWSNNFHRYDLVSNTWSEPEVIQTARTESGFTRLDGVDVVFNGDNITDVSGSQILLPYSQRPLGFFPLEGGSGERVFWFKSPSSMGESAEIRAYRPHVFVLAGKMSLTDQETGSMIYNGYNNRHVAANDGRVWLGLDWLNYQKGSGFGDAGTLPMPVCDSCSQDAIAFGPDATAMVVWDHFTGYYRSQSFLSRYSSDGSLSSTTTMPQAAPRVLDEGSLLLSSDGLRFAAVQDAFTSDTHQTYLYLGNR